MECDERDFAYLSASVSVSLAEPPVVVSSLDRDGWWWPRRWWWWRPGTELLRLPPLLLPAEAVRGVTVILLLPAAIPPLFVPDEDVEVFLLAGGRPAELDALLLDFDWAGWRADRAEREPTLAAGCEKRSELDDGGAAPSVLEYNTLDFDYEETIRPISLKIGL